jgi:hypothetical protein
MMSASVLCILPLCVLAGAAVALLLLIAIKRHHGDGHDARGR